MDAAREQQRTILEQNDGATGIDPQLLVSANQSPWFFVRDWRHIVVAVGVLLIAFPLVMAFSDVTKIEHEQAEHMHTTSAP